MNEKSNKKIIFLTILLGGLIIALVVLLFMFVFNKDNVENNNIVEHQNIIKVNTNESINEIKTLKGLTFESTKIVYQGGISILTTKVTNNDSIAYEKELFRIIVKGKDGNVIEELSAFITGGLNANESREISSAIDIDLSSAAYFVEYEEVE